MGFFFLHKYTSSSHTKTLSGTEFLWGSLLQFSRHQVSQDHRSSGTGARHAKGVWESRMKRFATPSCKLASSGRTWHSTLMAATEPTNTDLGETRRGPEPFRIHPYSSTPAIAERSSRQSQEVCGRTCFLSQETEKM